MSTDLIKCAICSKEMSVITWKHLANHNISIKEYKQLYPLHPTKSQSAILIKKESAKKTNASRIGISRSEEVKQKIKQTKKDNLKEAWNKGISRTLEQNQHLSNVRKERFESGEIVHWNQGGSCSDNTKKQISETLLSQNREYSIDSKIKRQLTIEQKIKNGWIHSSTLNKGIPSNISDENRKKLSILSTERNKERTTNRFDELSDFLQQYDIKIIDTDGYNIQVLCNKCNTTFSRTSSVFVPYRYELYNGEYCPTCFPPQIGYYSTSFFNKHPDMKDQFGILYIALVDDVEQFIKIGITNRTAHQRLLYEPYNFDVLCEIPTTIYAAYTIEQMLLKKYQANKYNPIIDFGGKTECLGIDVLTEDFLEFFETCLTSTEE